MIANNNTPTLIDSINKVFLEQFEERLFPCNITRDNNGKKLVHFQKDWTDTTKEYGNFDTEKANSIALRTGNGIVVVDVDTKDLSFLEPEMKTQIQKWIDDKATFIVETTKGYHFYFDSGDTIYSNSVRISDYIDIRGAGGCVFCYTQDSNSSYKIICDAELLPLTEEVIEYISLQEKEHNTTEYNYDENNLRIAVESHDFNDMMKQGADAQDLEKIINGAGYTVEDFTYTDGLYTRLNSLAYSVAMNPAIENKRVRPFIENVLTTYCEFDVDSDTSQKKLNQIFSTMIYCDESDNIEVVLEDISTEIQDDEKNIIDIDYTIPSELVKCNELYEYLNSCDSKTHPLASLTALFTITSAITSRGYYTHTRASSSLFILLIAKTGSGKNSVVKTPNQIMELLDQEDKIISSKISSEGAMDDIFKHQTSAIHILDEFGDQLAHMIGDTGGYLKVVASKMKNLYSLTNGTYKSGRYSSAGGKQSTDKPWSLSRPCYGLVGLTTQAQLLSNLKESMIHDGFLNRFIILNGQNIPSYFPDDIIYDIPNELIEHIQSIKVSKLYREVNDEDITEDNTNIFDEDEYTIIPLSTEANKYYAQYIGDADIPNSDIFNFCIDDEDETKRAISTRWRENTIRLAVAITAFERLEEVSLEVLLWCYNIVKASSINFLSLFKSDAPKSKYEVLKNKAITWFKKYSKYKHVSATFLAQNARPFSALKAKERKELLDDLVESNIIEYKQNRESNKITNLYKLVS
jgi:hypothetical protein